MFFTCVRAEETALDDDHRCSRDRRIVGICATRASAPKIAENREQATAVSKDMVVEGDVSEPTLRQETGRCCGNSEKRKIL